MDSHPEAVLSPVALSMHVKSVRHRTQGLELVCPGGPSRESRHDGRISPESHVCLHALQSADAPDIPRPSQVGVAHVIGLEGLEEGFDGDCPTGLEFPVEGQAGGLGSLRQGHPLSVDARVVVLQSHARLGAARDGLRQRSTSPRPEGRERAGIWVSRLRWRRPARGAHGE